MRRIALPVFVITLAVSGLAQAQGYSVVGGGSTHGDAQPAATGNGTANIAPAASPNAPTGGTATIAPAVGTGATGSSTARVTPVGETPSGRQPWDYAGLTPGATNARIPGISRREIRRAGARAVIAWPGFQMTPTGSRVFIATTRPVSVSAPVHTPGRWTYRLSPAYIPIANNLRPLVTSAFETPVDRAYLRRHGSTAELIIETSADAQPQLSQQNDAAGGLSYIFLDFPRWNPPDHRPRMMREGPIAPGQGVRLSPGQEGGNTTPTTEPDDEQPPPVVR